MESCSGDELLTAGGGEVDIAFLCERGGCESITGGFGESFLATGGVESARECDVAFFFPSGIGELLSLGGN